MPGSGLASNEADYEAFVVDDKCCLRSREACQINSRAWVSTGSPPMRSRPSSDSRSFKYAIREVERGVMTRSYRSTTTMPSGRPIGTAIYVMYTDDSDSFSGMHRLDADELWHFYLGDPLGMLMLCPDGSQKEVTLGAETSELDSNSSKSYRREPGWALPSLAGVRLALIACTMSPGFMVEGFEAGNREALCAQYPRAATGLSNLLIIRPRQPGPSRLPHGRPSASLD